LFAATVIADVFTEQINDDDDDDNFVGRYGKIAQLGPNPIKH